MKQKQFCFRKASAWWTCPSLNAACPSARPAGSSSTSSCAGRGGWPCRRERLPSWKCISGRFTSYNNSVSIIWQALGLRSLSFKSSIWCLSLVKCFDNQFSAYFHPGPATCGYWGTCFWCECPPAGHWSYPSPAICYRPCLIVSRSPRPFLVTVVGNAWELFTKMMK